MRKMLPLLCAVLFLFAGNAKASPVCGSGSVCNPTGITFNAAMGTTIQTLYTAPSAPAGNGVEVLGIYCTSFTNLAGNNGVYVYETHGGIAFPIAEPTIPGAYGGSGNPTTNILVDHTANGAAATAFTSLPTDGNGNPFILLAPGDSLQLGLFFSLSGSATLTCNAQVIQG